MPDTPDSWWSTSAWLQWLADFFIWLFEDIWNAFTGFLSDLFRPLLDALVDMWDGFWGGLGELLWTWFVEPFALLIEWAFNAFMDQVPAPPSFFGDIQNGLLWAVGSMGGLCEFVNLPLVFGGVGVALSGWVIGFGIRMARTVTVVFK